jgi:hypothetical protein
MPNRLAPPVFQFVNSAGQPYAGGTLEFYGAGGSTPLAVYANPDLATGGSTTVDLNSAGWPDTAIYLQNLPYKIILKDADDTTIWTIDNYHPTNLASVPLWQVGSGSPEGNVAGTAGSSGVQPSLYWDYTNRVLYVCKTTGDAANAQWEAINAAAATPAVPGPQGYLTPTSNTPIILSDSSAATALYYTPFTGNLVPIYNGARFVPTEFTQLTLTLASQHTASNIFDVFVFSNDGVLTLVTGPAWGTPTAGSGARGTGAGTTELTRLNGFWVNAVSMTGRNGSTTYSIDANKATYLGSLSIDGSNGQVTCHRAWGASRKWGIWNAYNRQPIYLQAGDSTATWSYNNATIRQSNGAAGNTLAVFMGLAEEFATLEFLQHMQVTSGVTNTGNIGIGINSTTAMTGKIGTYFMHTNSSGATIGGTAKHFMAPSLGINNINATENTSGAITFMGGNDDMILSALYRG